MFSRPNATLGQLHPPTGTEVLLGQFRHLSPSRQGFLVCPPGSLQHFGPWLTPKRRGHWQVHGQTAETVSLQSLLLVGMCPQGTGEYLYSMSSAETVAVSSRGRVLSSSPTPALQLGRPIWSISS